MDIIFKDLEAETIHVCIAWALLNILGCFLFCYLLLCSSFTDCFCTWNLGIGEQRFLATGMWLVGSGSETMGCGVVSV